MRLTHLTALGAGCIAVVALQSLPPDGPARPEARTGSSQGVSADALGASRDPGAAFFLPLTATGATVRTAAGPARVLEVPAQRTKPFSLLGVTWADPRVDLDGTVQARTRNSRSGQWSGWLQVSGGSDDAPDIGSTERAAPGARGGTAPLWAGPSDGVQVRVLPGRSPLPTGLRVDLVDPGTGTQSSVEPRVLPEVGPGPLGRRLTRREYTADRPAIVTRAGWKADESLIKGSTPEYTGTVKVVFVHHTATGNDYDCAEADALIRSIYRYHVQSNGWRDIGYNFLVDKCGTLYEGRSGGVARPVMGAHTLGFNSDSTGIAALGTFSDGETPVKMLEAIARLAAWKLGLGGRDPLGSAVLGSKQTTLRAISGHRDALATQCPGNALYAELPQIRSEAAELQGR
ncbi:peptidoglycan recognition protein [Streptomyces sp. NPDC092296]|uniref:peptidoglycan recognition protein family protein n=1 Tax=Streptomyces sp. NPDC092296 TaxID=3366012 RepID=UPI0038067F9C